MRAAATRGASSLIRRRANARVSPIFSSNVPVTLKQNRCFALSVNVGRGTSPKEPSPTFERTPEQIKAALAEHERMIFATKRILQLDKLTPASTQELRVVFHYWTGARSHSVQTKNNTELNALHQAESLLDWMFDNNIDSDSLYTVIQTDDCASGAMINMIDSYLMVFRGTHQSLKTISDRRIRSHKNAVQLKTALLKATSLMNRLEGLFDDPSYPKLIPDEFAYNMMLNLWVKRCWFLAEHGDSIDASHDKEFIKIALKGATTVKSCLQQMKQFMDTLPPSADATSKVSLYLTAWANSGLPYRAEKCHDILRMAENDPAVKLTSVAYNTVLSAYASLATKHPEYANDAELLFTHMSEQEGNVEPNVATYSSLLRAHANAGNANAAVELLMLMEEDFDTSDGPFPNTICYNIVLDALAKRSADEDVQTADGLLRRMQSMSDSGVNPLVAPDTVSYTSVIQAWSRSSIPGGAEKAEQLLFQCRDLSTTNKNVAPDVVMYNIVLNAWAGHNRRQRHDSNETQDKGDSGARRAESLLQRMKESDEVSPDVYSYNIIMNAWSNTGNVKAAAQRARELLEEMKREYRAGNEDVKPDAITYNTVIKLVSRTGERGCSDEARALMNEMQNQGLKIQTVTCNTIMTAIVKSDEPNAVKRAEEMFEEMEQMYQQGNKSVRPGEITFNILLHAYAKSKDPNDAKKAERLLNRMVASAQNGNRNATRPSIESFGTVLDAYARTGQSRAAESLLDKMSASGGVEINTITCNTVLNAFAKSKDKDAPYRAEALLNRMQQEYEAGNERVKPNSISFSSLLNSWAKSDLEGAAERAESILRRMEDLAARGNTHIAPNAVSYSTVLHAWARSGDANSAERAISILERMQKAHAEGKHYAKPNAYCYNATINAIAKSRMPNKAEKAHELLQRMIQAFENGNDSARPSATSFSTVLNACAYTDPPELHQQAFQIARTTLVEFLEQDKYGKPNVVTYVNFLNCCARLLPAGSARDNMMSATFEECCKQGVVNSKVVNILKRAVDPQVFDKCMVMMNASDADGFDVNAAGGV